MALTCKALGFDASPCVVLDEPKVVRALLRQGADPIAKDALGRTAAMGAMLAGRARALREARDAADSLRTGTHGLPKLASVTRADGVFTTQNPRRHRVPTRYCTSVEKRARHARMGAWAHGRAPAPRFQRGVEIGSPAHLI